MTDEAAESRRPATAEPAGQSQHPLPGSAPSAADDSPPAADSPPATGDSRPAAAPAGAEAPATPPPPAMPAPKAMPAPAPMPAPPSMPAGTPPADPPPAAGPAARTPTGSPTAETPAAAPSRPTDPPPAPGGPPPSGPPPGGPGGPPGGTGGPPPGGPGGFPPWGAGPTRGAFASRYGLVRPRDGRYLAGVCAAIGRATNTDPILWRVLLAVLGFFGGIGILVYVAVWLLTPAEGDSTSPVESMLGRGRSSMSPVTVIVLGVLVAVMFGFIVTDSFRAVMLGTAVLIGGALLLNRNSAGPPPNGPGGGGAPPPAAPPGGGPGPGVPPYPGPAAAPYPGPAPVFPPGPVPPAPATGGVHAAYQPAGHHTPPGAAASPDLTKSPVAAGPPDLTKSRPVPPAHPPTVGSPSPYVSETAPSPAGTDRTAVTAVLPPVWPAGPPVSVPPPPLGPGGGYRPPFAPHGPYAGAGPLPPVPPKPVKPPKPPKERSPLGAATFSMIFVLLGLLALLQVAGVVSPGPSAYFAVVLATIAVGLLVGAWFGRARWLIALGLVAAAALGFTTMVESYNDGRPDQAVVVWSPTSHDELATRYSNTFGDATLDLRSVDFSGQDTQITVDVALGTVTVLVPPQVDVVAVTNIGAGDARVFGQRWSGIDSNNREVRDLGADGTGGGDLRLYLNVKAGDVEVRR
ncbi:LiaF-related protein [Polymorphospora sp. A560]